MSASQSFQILPKYSTAHFRYLNILKDITGDFKNTNGEPCLTTGRLLLIGVGILRGELSFNFPQLSEMSMIFSERSVIHVVDNNQKIVDILNRSKRPVSTAEGAWEICKEFNELIDPSQSIEGMEYYMRREHEERAPITCWRWDPHLDETFHEKITEQYTHMIATSSCFTYGDRSKYLDTAIKLILLLDNKGSLFINIAGYCGIFGCDEEVRKTTEKIEKATLSKLKIRFLQNVIRIKKSKLDTMTSRGDISYFKVKFNKEDVFGNVQIFAKEYNNKVVLNGIEHVSNISSINTQPVAVIEREIEQMTILANTCFKEHYWLYIAKNWNSLNDKSPEWEEKLGTQSLADISEYDLQSPAFEQKRLGEQSYQQVSENEQWTPLHVAVLSKNTQAIPYFIKKGVDPDKKDRWDHTALDYLKKFQLPKLREFEPLLTSKLSFENQ